MRFIRDLEELKKQCPNEAQCNPCAEEKENCNLADLEKAANWECKKFVSGWVSTGGKPFIIKKKENDPKTDVIYSRRGRGFLYFIFKEDSELTRKLTSYGSRNHPESLGWINRCEHPNSFNLRVFELTDRYLYLRWPASKFEKIAFNAILHIPGIYKKGKIIPYKQDYLLSNADFKSIFHAKIGYEKGGSFSPAGLTEIKRKNQKKSVEEKFLEAKSKSTEAEDED